MHTHQATVNYVCLPQGVQAGKRVIRQSRQGVVGEVERPVGEDGDTRFKMRKDERHKYKRKNTQAHTSHYCELGMLTPRSLGRQTCFAAELSSVFLTLARPHARR